MYIPEQKNTDAVCKWNEVRLQGLLCCLCLPGSCFLFFYLPLRKAVRAYIREKNPLNFLSGSHSGYMIKKECISLSRPWFAWPGEMSGPVIPWEWDKLKWSLDFFLFIHIILVRRSLHSAAVSLWSCTNPYISLVLHSSAQWNRENAQLLLPYRAKEWLVCSVWWDAPMKAAV